MFFGAINFNTIPEIGFAHHFYTENYRSSYEKLQKSLEVVYVKSGAITAELYGRKLYIPEKSIFVLFRQLPLQLFSSTRGSQAHCTVQAVFDFDFTLIEDEAAAGCGLLLPFVIPSCRETEEIKRDLFAIVSELGISREENSFSASLRLLDILRRLDKIARNRLAADSSHSSLITYKTKHFISENLDRSISLAQLSQALRLSAGHIDHVFKSEVGIPIKQYINIEKAKKISELIQSRGLSFKTACANVGISDVSYGYRLFKRHIGMTPGEFLSGFVHQKR